MDSRRRREFGLISHAHSDHTARHSQPVLTRNTGLLLSEYLQKCSPVLLDYYEPLETSKYVITLYPAGHCLGSAQALVQSKSTGLKLLYTGDLKVRSSPTNEPLEPVPCDVLVIEATYGRPEYIFPPQEQVLATACQILRSWLSRGERPVVQGWRLGKAQEILHLLLGKGFDVAAEESIYRIARIYEQGGVSFPAPYRAFDGSWSEGEILVCPPGRASQRLLKDFRGLRLMELTGWAQGRGAWGRRGDASLPYSDHADFNELVDYVNRVQPKEVYTVNGFPDLAAHLRRLGYPAVHLDGRGPAGGEGFQFRLV